MANSKCCKYKVGSEIREYTPDRWTISSDFPTDNNLALHIITSPSKFADKTIRTVTDELLEDNDKENLCSLYYTITWLLDNITEYKNNTVARGILGEIDDHCEKCPKKDYKCKCVKKLGQEVYDINSKDCDEEFLWNDKKCKCVKEPKEEEDEGEVAPIEDEKVRGCMVNPKGLPDDVTVNYNPEATLNFGCVFKKSVNLENKFCFCVTDTCEEVGRCITGKQVLTVKARSYESFELIYDRVRERALKAISSIMPTLRISGEKGFYSKNVLNTDVNDLANALTLLELKNYNLSQAKGQLDKSDLVMTDEYGNYLGFFNGVLMTSPPFEKLKLQLSGAVLRKRLLNNVGEYIPSNWTDTIRNLILTRKDYYAGISLGVDGIIIKESNVGLINVLKEEPIGLGKLLK